MLQLNPLPSINESLQTSSNSSHIIRLIGLMKPKIIILLALTGMIAFLLPSVGNLSFVHLISYVTLGSMTAGGAMVINNIIDQDIDQEMMRTKSRASVGDHRYSNSAILFFGASQVLVGTWGSFYLYGIYTAIHLLWGALFYIVGYSILLKRNSIFNTILGGLASPAPVLGAYAARYELAGLNSQDLFLGVPTIGWVIGGLVFLWTPTHTWAMAVKNYDDYRKVDIPMLPVILGIPKTANIVFVGGLGLVLYGGWMLSIITMTGFFLSIPIQFLFVRSLVKFQSNPTIQGGTQNFYWHNIWLAAIFILLIF